MKKLVLMFGILASGIVFMFSTQASDADGWDEIVRQIQEKQEQKGIPLHEFIRQEQIQEQEQERRKIGAVSIDEWERGILKCYIEEDRNACQALINGGVASVEQCGYYNNISGYVPSIDCLSLGDLFNHGIRDYRKAIPYFEKAIALGDDRNGYSALANAYRNLQDYYNAKKYYEIVCSGSGIKMGRAAESCYNLGLMYFKGKGVRQDYAKVAELWKQACLGEYARACYSLGVLHNKACGFSDTDCDIFFGRF